MSVKNTVERAAENEVQLNTVYEREKQDERGRSEIPNLPYHQQAHITILVNTTTNNDNNHNNQQYLANFEPNPLCAAQVCP